MHATEGAPAPSSDHRGREVLSRPALGPASGARARGRARSPVRPPRRTVEGSRAACATATQTQCTWGALQQAHTMLMQELRARRSINRKTIAVCARY